MRPWGWQGEVGGGNSGAVARAALFDNFFMQCFLSLSFSLLFAFSFAAFLSMLQVEGTAGFLHEREEIKRITYKALRLFQRFYFIPSPSLSFSLSLLLFLDLPLVFCAFASFGVMKDIERALGIRLARHVDL